MGQLQPCLGSASPLPAKASSRLRKPDNRLLTKERQLSDLCTGLQCLVAVGYHMTNSMLLKPLSSRVHDYRTLQDAQETMLGKAGTVACMYLAYYAPGSLVTCDCWSPSQCPYHQHHDVVLDVSLAPWTDPKLGRKDARNHPS